MTNLSDALEWLRHIASGDDDTLSRRWMGEALDCLAMLELKPEFEEVEIAKRVNEFLHQVGHGLIAGTGVADVKFATIIAYRLLQIRKELEEV